MHCCCTFTIALAGLFLLCFDCHFFGAQAETFAEWRSTVGFRFHTACKIMLAFCKAAAYFHCLLFDASSNSFLLSTSTPRCLRLFTASMYRECNMCCAVTWNDDEGVDMSDHTAANMSHHTAAANISQSDAVNGTDSDFSDAGRCVSSAMRANERSAVCMTPNCF